MGLISFKFKLFKLLIYREPVMPGIRTMIFGKQPGDHNPSISQSYSICLLLPLHPKTYYED